ncbi:MAG: aldose 1-epimerase [Pseudomonadota bacterium]
MPEGEIQLSNDPLRLGLRPANGGSISRLDWQGADGTVHQIMRAGLDDPAHISDPRDLACFPLFPFSNRIADARLHMGEQVFNLPVNFPPEPHCIHGDSWQYPWSVGPAGDHVISLTYESDRLGPPFDFAASQKFTLDEDRLTIDLALTNSGTQPMPGGMGLHPYIPKPDNTRLQATLPKVWLSDETNIPTERVDAPADWDFSTGRSLDGVIVDNNFSRWDGIARVEWPDRPFALQITASEALRNVVLFAPEGGDFFCFEPVSHANNAMNQPLESWEEHGVVLLQPGETLRGSISFHVVGH